MSCVSCRLAGREKSPQKRPIPGMQSVSRMRSYPAVLLTCLIACGCRQSQPQPTLPIMAFTILCNEMGRLTQRYWCDGGASCTGSRRPSCHREIRRTQIQLAFFLHVEIEVMIYFNFASKVGRTASIFLSHWTYTWHLRRAHPRFLFDKHSISSMAPSDLSRPEWPRIATRSGLVRVSRSEK